MPPPAIEPGTLDEEETATGSFSLAEARHIVRDLFTPNPWIFWTDFLVSLGIGGIFFGLVRHLPPWMPLKPVAGVVCFVVSCLLYYRCALFIHEIVHIRTGTFRVFRVVWNLLCGIPFLLPSFTYYTHLDHHRRKQYGTKEDGEYLSLGRQSPWAIVYYLSQSFVVPGLVVLRFLVLTPLTWLVPPVRRWVYQRMSSLVMDPSYVRPLPARDVLRVWRLQELGCFLFCVAAGVLLYRGAQPGADPDGPMPELHGVLPLSILVQAYATGVFIVLLNEIRTLGAHRFLNDGREMTFVEQLVDSVNYPRRPWLTCLWAPVGLRFHALHHLFPSLPYHNLAEAHRRLMAELPADSPYRQTIGESLTGALVQLWRAAIRSRGTPSMAAS